MKKFITMGLVGFGILLLAETGTPIWPYMIGGLVAFALGLYLLYRKGGE